MTGLYSTLAHALLSGWLLAGPAISETPEIPWPSSEAYPHGRRVFDNTLISEGGPSIQIRATEAFEYVSRTRFSLKERADAEVFLFAEIQGDVITRYLQVQF